MTKRLLDKVDLSLELTGHRISAVEVDGDRTDFSAITLILDTGARFEFGGGNDAEGEYVFCQRVFPQGGSDG